MTDDKREEWYVEPTLTHELGSLVMEGNRPIAICPRESEALRVVADHNARTQLEERVRDLEAALREGRRIAGKSWSTGMGFNGPPSPREWRAWMSDVDALLSPAAATEGGEGA